MGIGVGIMRQYFGQPNRQPLASNSFQFDIDPVKSKLYIADDYNCDGQVVGKLPSIIVQVGDRTFQKMALGDKIGVDDSGNNIKTRKVNTFWTFSCYGSKKQESGELGSEIEYFMASYSQELAAEYGFMGLECQQRSRIEKSVEYQNMFVCQLRVVFAFTEQWLIEQEGLVVKTVSFKTDVPVL